MSNPASDRRKFISDNSHAMTLVELLVAAAIIGVITAIVIPLYANYARKEIRDTVQADLDNFFNYEVSKAHPAIEVSALVTQVHYTGTKRSGDSVVDRVYRSLPDGVTYVGAPPSMNIDDTRRVYIALSLKEIKTIGSLFPDVIPEKGEKIKISDRVQAQLESHDFEVKPETPTTQAVRSNGVTKWSWAIKGKSEGKHTLNLTISALVDVGGKETPLVLTTYTKTIIVEVTLLQTGWRFTKENMSWLWAPLAAIIGTLWALINFSKKPFSQNATYWSSGPRRVHRFKSRSAQ